MLERKKTKKLKRKKGSKKANDEFPSENMFDKSDLDLFIERNLRKGNPDSRNSHRQLSTIHSHANEDMGSSESDRDSLGGDSNCQDFDEEEHSQILMGFLRQLDPVKFAAE